MVCRDLKRFFRRIWKNPDARQKVAFCLAVSSFMVPPELRDDAAGFIEPLYSMMDFSMVCLVAAAYV